MLWNDESRAERERQLDIIGQIPSNKIDVPDFGQYSKDEMAEFERRHLMELAEQTKKYDLNEQMVVAENLDPFVCFNAVGKWMDMARGQIAQANALFNGPTEDQNG